jgi:hypothetical protein
MIARETPRTTRLVIRSLSNHGETDPDTIARAAGARYSEEQVLGDWFPGGSIRAGSERPAADCTTPP